MLKILFLQVVAAAFLAGVLAPAAEAQTLYAGPGTVVFGPTWTPYSSLPLGFYPYGYAYPPPLYIYPFVSPPSRYLTPSYSYQANPFAQFPNTFSYELPPFTYGPNLYTYDLRAYGSGPGVYPPAANPYGYYHYYFNLPTIPAYAGGVYRPMSLREYKLRQLRGPVRVRDIVPGVPQLSG